MGLLKTIFGKLKYSLGLDTFFGGTKYFESFVAPNGKIYAIPHTSSRVLSIDPINKTALLFGNLDSGSLKWVGGGMNGTTIYGIPYNSDKLMKIDTNSNSFVYFGNFPGSYKWASGCVASNGKLYCAPFTSNSVLIVNTLDDSAELIPIPSALNGSAKWLGAVEVNGYVYFIPSSANVVLVMKIADNSFTTISVTSSGGLEWGSGYLAPNGKIYCVPRGNDKILVIDPTTNTVSYFGSFGTAQKWLYAGLKGNKIYCAPMTATNMLVINTLNDTYELVGSFPVGVEKWTGCSIVGDELFLTPFNAPNARVENLTNIAPSVGKIILDAKFQNNLTDNSEFGNTFVADNANGLPTFVSGPKGTDKAIYFDGTKRLKTSSNIYIDSDSIVSYSFYLSTTQTTLATFIEIGNGAGPVTSGVWINNLANTLDGVSLDGGHNTARVPLTQNGVWNHIVVNIDKRKPAQSEIEIIINKVVQTITKPFSVEGVNNFSPNPLYLGQRVNGTYSFTGKLAYLKIRNYIPNSSEVAVDFSAGYVPPSGSAKKIVLIGDSTITSQACRPTTIASNLLTPSEISDGWTATNLAIGGATINAQLSTWNAHSNKTDYDIIIIQVGLNDMNTAIGTTLTNYQNLINQINATKKTGAKVYISCMLPCKSRWAVLGWVNGQSNWLALNNAIMDSTFTGVDGRNNYHVSLLADSEGNLAPIYDCGDKIHETQSGADIIIQGFRALIF